MFSLDKNKMFFLEKKQYLFFSRKQFFFLAKTIFIFYHLSLLVFGRDIFRCTIALFRFNKIGKTEKNRYFLVAQKLFFAQFFFRYRIDLFRIPPNSTENEDLNLYGEISNANNNRTINSSILKAICYRWEIKIRLIYEGEILRY